VAQADQLKLTNGATVVVLDPGRGGAISEFYTDLAAGAGAACEHRRHWLKPADQQYPACFPVVPWCSRIRQGQFCFAGQDVQIIGTERHPIHGHGWQAQWQCLQTEGAQAELHFAYQAADWPWSYQVRQRFHLSPDSLQIQMMVHNQSSQVMPVAAGWHPFFSATPAMRVQAPVLRAWQMDDAGFPRTLLNPLDCPGNNHVTLLRDEVAARELQLDTIFSVAPGEVRVIWPEWQMQLAMRASTNLQQLVVWTPADEPFVCLEPLSGFAHNEGFAALAPDQTFTCGIVLALHPLAQETTDVRCGH